MEKAMIYYAGLDVSLRTVNLCVIDSQGELVAETKLASDVQDIVAYLDALELDLASVGLEAGTLTQYLSYGLQAAGFEVICMEARQVKGALSAMRNKTDKHDARGIAWILKTKCAACSKCSASSYRPSSVMVLSMSLCVTLSKRMRRCRTHCCHCLMPGLCCIGPFAYLITEPAKWRMQIRSAFDS
jgi:hypothetical protein